MGDGLGSFHQHYLLDGRIIAVGVVDILPHSVSSVYLYYDPDYRFLSLGTLTSLLEIGMVRSFAAGSGPSTSITNYYLGFYIHSCIKMRYKGRFSPSYLACPETYRWLPLSHCTSLLDKSPYSRLDTEKAEEETALDISEAGVLFGRRAITYSLYQQLLAADQLEGDEREVEEYVGLVGEAVAKRVLLYRAE